MREELLDSSALARQLKLRRGLIPVEIDSARREVIWEDLGSWHCYEGFFRDSLHAHRALGRRQPLRFRTPLEALAASDRNIANELSPQAFVFHAGRSGSTLVVRVLARSRSNLVFSEAEAHDQIWEVLSRDQPADIDLYRRLILAMGRRRIDSHRVHIVKFTSHNIMRFRLIRTAFPGVPALFLFREPSEILASFARETPAWLGKELGCGFRWETPEAAVQEFFRAAISIADPDFRCLDYRSLRPDILPALTGFLGVNPSPEDLHVMRGEFALDSKRGLSARLFSGCASHPTSPASGILRLQYAHLSELAAQAWNF